MKAWSSANAAARPPLVSVPALGLLGWGALTVLAVGAVHLEQLISPSFWVIPRDRSAVRPELCRLAARGSGVAVAGGGAPPCCGYWRPRGIAIAAAGLGFPLASEATFMFGFKESNYRPEVVTSIAVPLSPYRMSKQQGSRPDGAGKVGRHSLPQQV